MMSKIAEKILCRQCHKRIQENRKSICCRTCHVWHQKIKCSGLSDNEFENRLHKKNIIWDCQKCFYFPCSKCSKRVSDNQNSMQCEFCEQWVQSNSLGCPTNISKIIQICWSCNLASFAFVLLNSTEILKLPGSNQNNKNKTLKASIPFCFVCEKRKIYIESFEKCM